MIPLFDAISWWNKFWFEPRPAVNLAIFRLLVGIPLFFLYLNRHFYLEVYFHPEGMVPLEFVPDVFLPFSYPPVVWYFEDFFWIQVAHGFYLALLLLMSFGLLPRPLGVGLWMLHVGFLQRNFSVAYGVDVLAGIWLLYLSLTGSGGVNLIGLIRDGSSVFRGKTDLLSTVGYRLIQVHVCIIYVYTGIEKLKGNSWWDGTALWRVFSNPQMVIMDMSFILYMPWVVAVITFMTLLFEIYFPVLVWLRGWRKVMLLLGVAFHMGIAIALALPVFSLCMMATYVLFLDRGQSSFRDFSS